MVSTAQLSFSCPQPPARLSAEPPVGRPPVPVPPRRAVRSGALSAPRRFRRSSAAGPALRTAQSLGRGAAAAPKLLLAGARCRAAGRAVRCGGGACRLFHFASFTCFTEVAPAAASAPLSRPRRGEPGALLPPPVLPGSAAPAGRGSGARSGLAVRGCGGEVYGGFEMILPLCLL